LVTAGITTFYMFRMWFLTFAASARSFMFTNMRTSPLWLMTVPLILLAILSVGVAWPAPTSHGWPLLDVQHSWLGGELHHYSQPKTAEFKGIVDIMTIRCRPMSISSPKPR